MAHPILLLHGDDDRRSLLAYLLDQWGYEVTDTGDSRRAARELLQTSTPMIAILHHGVEGQPAIADLCRDTRKSPHEASKYVIIVEEELDDRCLERDFDDGADDVMVEPLRPAELRLRLRRAGRALERGEQYSGGHTE